MAEGNEKLVFFYTNEIGNQSVIDSYPNGSVIISKRDDEQKLGDVFVKLDNKLYHIKPDYSWEDLTQGVDVQKYFFDDMGRFFFNNYLRIEKSSDGDQLDFYIADGNDIPVTDNDNLVTTQNFNTVFEENFDTLVGENITTGTTNGTFNVGTRPVPIYGLESAAYTETDAYVPMEISYWQDIDDSNN